ncbi:SPPV_148 [Sheeppox virus]
MEYISNYDKLLKEIYINQSNLKINVLKKIINDIPTKYHKGIYNNLLLTVLGNKSISLSVQKYKKILSFLVDNGADLNTKIKYKYNALHYYLYSNSNVTVDILKFLIKKGADIKKKCNGDNVLHTYLCNKNIDFKVIKFLVNKKIDLGDRNLDNHTPGDIYISNKRNNCEIDTLKLLFLVDFNIYNKEDIFLSALDVFLNYLKSYTRKSLDIVNYILENISINSVDSNGFNPILYATVSGQKVFFDYFLKLGCNINITTSCGETCGSLSLMDCDYCIFKTFLSKKPNLQTIENTLSYLSNFLENIYYCDLKFKMFKELLLKAFMLDSEFYNRHESIKLYFPKTISLYKEPIVQMCGDKIGNKSVYDIIFKNSDIMCCYNDYINKYTNLKYYGNIIRKYILASKMRKKNIVKIIKTINIAPYWNTLPTEIKMYIINFLSDNEIKLLVIK